MRKNMFFGIATLGVAGVFLAAPAANAATDSGSLGFDDNNVKPGATLTAIGGCNAEGFTTAKLQSTVLEPSEVYLKDAGDGGAKSLAGTAVVKKDAKPGTYPVSFMCGKQLVTFKLTIVGAVKTPPTSTTTKTATQAPAKPAGQVAIKPKGAADTGDGDVADIAAVTDTVAAQADSGPGAGTWALGGAALVAVAGAGAFGFRRLRKES